MTKQIKPTGYQDWTCHKCQGINTARRSKLEIFMSGRSRIQCKHCKAIFQMIKGEIIGEGLSVGDISQAPIPANEAICPTSQPRGDTSEQSDIVGHGGMGG